MSTVLEKSLLDIHPRELKGMVNDIPTLPAIYQKLFDKLQDPDVSVPEIAEIITQDQALSAKILHLVNSALYGSGTKTMTISRAVVILGFRAVRGAAMAALPTVAARTARSPLSVTHCHPCWRLDNGHRS